MDCVNDTAVYRPDNIYHMIFIHFHEVNIFHRLDNFLKP